MTCTQGVKVTAMALGDKLCKRLALEFLSSHTGHPLPVGLNGGLLPPATPVLHHSEQLGWWQVSCAASLMVVNIALSMVLQLNLHVHLAFAILGCLLQLTLLGYVVTYLTEWQHSWLLLLYACLAIAMATMEAVSRPNHTYMGMRLHMLTTISASSALVFLFSMMAVLQLPVDRVLQPQYLVPLFGLLVGHVISGIASGVTATLEELAAGRESVEVLLALGATRLEATRGTMQQAATKALLPIMEQMSVVGLVALPSFMAGQLITGAQPMQAAKYQIVVMFLTAAASGLGSIGAIYLAICTIVDNQHRLRLDRLQRRTQPHTGYIMVLVAIAKQAYFHVTKFVRRVKVAFFKRSYHSRPHPRPPLRPFIDPEYSSTPLHPTRRHNLSRPTPPGLIISTDEIPDAVGTSNLAISTAGIHNAAINNAAINNISNRSGGSYTPVVSPSEGNGSVIRDVDLQTTSLHTSTLHSPSAPVLVTATATTTSTTYGMIAAAAATMASSAVVGGDRLRQWLVSSISRGYSRTAGTAAGGTTEGYSNLQTVINPDTASEDGSYSDTYPIMDASLEQHRGRLPRISTGQLDMPPMASP